MNPIVEISSLTKKFDTGENPALSNINSLIPQGKIIALAGPDGAGKTTLMRLIAGLLIPTQGTITVDGLDSAQDSTAIHEIIGYMPQRFGLYEDITVSQNLDLYFELKQIPKDKKHNLYDRLLEFTGLKRFTDRLAGALSGGMKQKLGLACALMNTPKLLLLDEPTIGVDPLSRLDLWSMVKELMTEGVTVLWSTSYLDEAERCDSIVLLNEGKLIFQGTPQELFLKEQGKAFRISGFGDQMRQTAKSLRHHPDVADTIILGDEIRILLNSPDHIDAVFSSLPNHEKLACKPDAPTVEDAYLELIGVTHEKESPLSRHLPDISDNRQEMIMAEKLKKNFGNFTAVNEISFTINRGEIFGLLGPNGAGKSTTFRMLCGLIQPTSGKTLVCGYDLSHAPAAGRAQIGYMAQKFSLYNNLSTMENLMFFSGLYGLSGTMQNVRVEEMVEIFDLQHHLNINAGELPLGYKQRLALSCALMHNPKILFLDEPTSGVDPATRREFWSHINALRDKGTTIMVTTHFMDEAEYCDRLALIYRGNTISLGSSKELKQKASSEKYPNPTLEEAFITLISQHNEKNNG